MNNKIKLKAEYIHPSDNLTNYPALKKFIETIQFASEFEIGTYCLYGEKELQTKLLSISSHNGVFHEIIRKQHLLNTLENQDCLTITQFSALISIFTRKEGNFDQLKNHAALGNTIVAEVTSKTFGWLLWSWQIMAVVSYYLPTLEQNVFISHLNAKNKGAWDLLNETEISHNLKLIQLIKQNSLGLHYDNPSFYFGKQLQQLIQQ